MELMDVLAARHSVRAYTDEPVARETLTQLLQAAVLAPTGMNLQPWAFGVIQGADRLCDYSDRAKVYLLANMAQFPMFERYRGWLDDPDSNLCHGATAAIIVYAKPGGATPEQDCTMAAQNIMLAAVNAGLGTCWIGFLSFALNLPEVKQELGVPDDYKVVAPIIIGHPAGPVPGVEKAPPEVIFWQG